MSTSVLMSASPSYLNCSVSFSAMASYFDCSTIFIATFWGVFFLILLVGSLGMLIVLNCFPELDSPGELPSILDS